MGHPILSPRDTWFTGGAASAGVSKSSITEIHIVDSYTPSAAAISWNATDSNVDKATVYVEDSKLTIAGNGSGKVMANPDSYELFNEFSGLVSFDSGVLDTSMVTDLSRAFRKCSLIEYLDLTSWNVEAVKSLTTTFSQMLKLKTLLVYNWNTKSLTNTRTTFQASPEIVVLDLSGWKFDLVTTMYCMFAGNTSAGGPMKLSKVIGIEDWDVSEVTDMTSLFNLNQGIKYLDLSKWNNAACTTTAGAFRSMSALSKFTVGEKFKFKGSGVHLSTPSGQYIEGADGKWYTISGEGYSVGDVQTGVARTYYASRSMVKDLDVVVKNGDLIDAADAIRETNGISDRMTTDRFGDVIRFGESFCYPTLSSTFLAQIKKEVVVETIRFVTEYDETDENIKKKWIADDMRTGSIVGYQTSVFGKKTIIISSKGAEKIRVAPNASNLFSDLPLLKTIEGLDMLDVSCVKFFDSAFSNCSAIVSIDLSCLNFSDKLVSYDRLFAGSYRLEEVVLWDGISFVSDGMFNACLNLRRITGLSGVTKIGSSSFTHATNLVDGGVDIDPQKITSIGDMACRRSNIEDVVDFTQSPLVNIGIHAIRSERWGASDLSDIRNFFSGKSYTNVYLEVPTPENQYNYPYTVLGYDKQGDPANIATWGCGAVTTYHEWNAVYNRRGEFDKVYHGFQSWWDNVVLTLDSDYAETNEVTTDSVPEIRNVLGWQYDQSKKYVYSVEQLKIIADRLSQGFPVFANIYSTNTLGSMHAVLIVGMKPTEGKIAMLDSSVVGHTGVVSWVRFEDLFVKGRLGDSDESDDKYYGMDSVWPVTDYNLPEVNA